MKRSYAMGVFAALGMLALAAAPPASAAKVVAGVVIDTQGKPEIKPVGKSSFKRLKLNKFVYEGDTIKTQDGERAAVALVGGAEVRINENSEFVMESGGGRSPSSIATKLGQAWTRLLHGKSGMQVKSPMAVAAVRGTEADVDVSDRMDVKVYEGMVDLTNDQGRVSLTAGMMGGVGGAGMAPSRGRRMGAGDYGTWQSGMAPQNLDKNLNRLRKKAERTRQIKLKWSKDGTPQELNLQLEKK
jgi:hypothetical protein